MVRDTSWNFAVNPANTPWIPGYRFWVWQISQTGGRRRVHRVTRQYRCFFEVSRDGTLICVPAAKGGGVKATDSTMASMQAQYAAERPGSNGGPRLDN